jgi:GntR family transcriptional repressor for pyruvate dehydrogenase complex
MDLIKKTNLSEAVYQEILKLIKTGEYKPGDKLPPEPELCKMLGVSRTALREGIRNLAMINIVTVSPGRGTFVQENPLIMVDDSTLELSLQRETIECIWEVRTILGVGIARYAAVKATKEDIAALEKAIEDLEASLREDPIDHDLAIKADKAFHLALCRSTQNTILDRMAWPIENHCMLRNWQKLKGNLNVVSNAIEGHKGILDAIKKRDAKKAMEEMDRHLQLAYKMSIPKP